MRVIRFHPMLALACLISSPAMADVKAGVDAWERGDYPGAVKEWRGPAINGDADAQFNLGQAYKLGRGVPADLKQAEDWYQKAAIQGHLQANDNYGLVLFQNGNRQRAMPYIEKSAARGEPRAQYLLGTALFNGDLVGKDWVRAYALMTRASASGLPAASASLAQMDKYVPLDQRQLGLAMARDIELAANRPLIPDSPKQPARPVVAERPPAPDAPAVAKPAPATSKPKPTPVASSYATPGGNWKVQLAAFGDASKGPSLWSGLSRRISALAGLQPSYQKAGPITRLQAGPLASRAAAERMCALVKASGQACLPVAP
jgi:uncharacterized protein